MGFGALAVASIPLRHCLKAALCTKKVMSWKRTWPCKPTTRSAQFWNCCCIGLNKFVDLPWNPTRLEQRIGRIKRFGQVSDSVDMLNLVNEQTIDEKVYERL
jgi:hypothetical protein